MRVEGHQHARNAHLPGACNGVVDQLDMTAVQPVEDTDGDDAATPSIRDGLKSTPTLHGR
jgi:hypothetical protein